MFLFAAFLAASRPAAAAEYPARLISAQLSALGLQTISLEGLAPPQSSPKAVAVSTAPAPLIADSDAHRGASTPGAADAVARARPA